MLTVLDLFAGGGSFSRGLERTGGFRTVAACEAASWKWPVLRWSVPPPAPVYPDVETLTGERVLYDVGAVDVVVGSPPCTDISSANPNGCGVDGAESRLFFEFCRLVGEVRPRWLIAENSPQLKTKGSDRVLDRLEQEGYAVWPLVVGAGHLGAPHLRDRVWLVGLDGSYAHDKLEFQRRCARARSVAPDPHTDDQGQRRSSRCESGRGAAEITESRDVRCAAAAADRDGAGLAIGKGIPLNGWLEFAALERAVGPAVHAWARGLGRYLRMADGISARAARGTMSLAGDAVVEEVVQCLGEAILAVDLELREAA